MSEANMNDELILLERVFFRIGSADTDTQLSSCINNFLVPVLQKLSSPHDSVRNKVVELLTHITRVVKQSPSIVLPVNQLVTLLATCSNSFVVNFTVVFIKISFGRIDCNKKIEFILPLINSIATKSVAHQETILLLILGALNKSNVQVASKDIAVIKDHPQLKSIILQLMLDLLLMPYKWSGSDEDSLAGFNTQSLKRLRLNIPIIFSDADYHEQVKLGILGLISANIFESRYVLVHSVVGAADTRYMVANSGENELRKITCEIDWSKSSTMMPLYALFIGTSLNKQDRAAKKEPACVRIRLKILPCLCLSKGEESVIWPQCMQIIFDCWNGENTNQRLKNLALQFAQIIIQQKSAKTLLQATPILLNSGLLKLLKSPELDLNAKQMTYTLIGLLISKVPTAVKEDLVLLDSFFKALIKETSPDLKGSIRSSLISMCSAYSESSKLSNILSMIAHYCKMSDGLLKQVTTHYLSTLFPADDAKSRLLLIQSHMSSVGDSDLKKILYNVDEAGNLVGKNENALLLPRFPDMVMTVVDSNEQYDSSVLLEIAEYLSHCLTFSAGLPVTYNTLYHPTKYTPEMCKYLSKVYQSDAKIVDHYFKLMMQLIQVKPSIIPLNNLLLCVAALPNELKSQFTKDLNTIQKLFVSSNEDMRQLSGILYGIILSALDEIISDKRIREITSYIVDKNRNKSLELHASLYALSSLQEYKFYGDKNFPPFIGEDTFTSLVTLLDETSPLIVGATCDVIGSIGRLNPVPIDDSNKSSLIKKLLSISFNSSIPSKIRNKAIKCTGLICVGESSPRSKDIIKEYLKNTKHTKDIEIHLSIGESLCCAILGPHSKMSCNFWTCAEDEYQKEIVTKFAVDECDKLADYFLNNILDKIQSEDHPNSKQACCVWMYNVLNECYSLNSVNQKLARIQTAYVELLTEKNNYIQDLASKALINVYEFEADNRKEQILKLLIKQLSEYMAVGNNGKDSSGGILSTYKELCSLVIDLNRPELLYKFIQLANFDKKKDAKSKLEIDEQLNEQLPFIIPRLYRYQYDPTPIVQSSMSAIWSYLVLDTRFTVDKYHKEIYVDLVKNITCPDWRVRISVCQAIPSFLQYTGDKIFTKCLDLTIEAWTQLIRVMDDIHEGTRKAATSTTKTLSKLCVNECTTNTQLLHLLLPIILDKGLYHTESSIRAVSMDMISQLIVNCGEKLKGDLAKLIIALLKGADKVETPTLSMLSVMSGANPNTQEFIDSQRAASARSLSSSDVLSKSLLYIDDTVLQDLIPLLQDVLITNIGLPTKVATSHFISLLITQKQQQLNSKFLDKILKSLMKGITDRNTTIRKSYASTIALITTVAKESTVNKLIQSLKDIYMENEDESIRQTVGYALKGISQCEKPDVYLPTIIPLIFFAIHYKGTESDEKVVNDKSLNIWQELWEDNVHNTEGVLSRHLESVYEFLGVAIKSSSWAMKAQAARSIGDAANTLGRQLNEDHRNKFIETIKTGLAGRTWDGKEFLLEALLQLNLNSGDSTETCKNEEIVELVFNECKKEKVSYRMVATKTLGELLEKLKIDRFAQTYQLVMHVIQKTTEDSDIDDQSQNLKLNESLFLLVGKAWPYTLATQVEFGETVVAQCADHLKNNTRLLQLAIMNSLLKVIQRLAFIQLHASHKQQLKYILSHVKRALHFSLGMYKYYQTILND
ncbi:Hypothetical protein CINCED_3A017518 [Cinara cedri]|uniref:Uncharacterized protein n=1 Tax=Cinara cedri TaxID=506608 RepID=A0A5E4M484_9HEMI|nr:Hypothetical protein CINCED_3A017518 [Cinara cedri]